MILRAVNSLYGGAIGDAFGGRYEFRNEQYQKDHATYQAVIPILGGGVWHLRPGQVTDDTEMALALAHSIIETGRVSTEAIAHEYHNWYLSVPFDIGKSTRSSVQHSDPQTMMAAAEQFNQQVQRMYGDHNMSNGPLMRVWPMAVYIAGIFSAGNMSDKGLATFVRQCVMEDVRLTHSSQEASWYVTAYVLMLTCAIIEGSLNRAITLIQSEYHKYMQVGDWYTVLMKGLDPSNRLVHDPIENAGDMRIAFQLAVRKGVFVMRGQMTYEEAIMSTVNLGGDTDTNAAIVGALCGALTNGDIHGPWKNAVKECRAERYNEYKPAQYLSDLEGLASTLLQAGHDGGV